MLNNMWNEFKPAFRFLLVFLGLYLAGNILYGLWIRSFQGLPDPATWVVTNQTAKVLDMLGYPVTVVQNMQGPTVYLLHKNRVVLNIYEGCNGINVMIVFVVFVVAFGGGVKKLGWFLPAGIVIIHLSNIVRIALLYFVAVGYRHYFYYVHKYVFTATIYLIVFLLWVVWVAIINGKPKKTATV